MLKLIVSLDCPPYIYNNLDKYILRYDIQFVIHMDPKNKSLLRYQMPPLEIALSKAKQSISNKMISKEKNYLLKINHTPQLNIPNHDYDTVVIITNCRITDIHDPKHYTLYLDDTNGKKIVQNQITATWTKRPEISKKVSYLGNSSTNIVKMNIDFFHHQNEYGYHIRSGDFISKIMHIPINRSINDYPSNLSSTVSNSIYNILPILIGILVIFLFVVGIIMLRKT